MVHTLLLTSQRSTHRPTLPCLLHRLNYKNLNHKMNCITECGFSVHAKNVFSPPVTFSGTNTKLIRMPPTHLLVSLDQNIGNSILNCTCVCIRIYLFLTSCSYKVLARCSFNLHNPVWDTGWFPKQMKLSDLSCLTTPTGVREILLKYGFF